MLDSDSFFTEVADKQTHMVNPAGNDWFVEFYSPYCGHCQHLAPIWDKYHSRNKESLNVARVDCTGDGNELCHAFGIRMYPTLLYMPKGQNQCYKYKGDRSVEAFESWVANGEWRDSEDKKEIATSKSFIESMLPSAETIQSMINKFLQ